MENNTIADLEKTYAAWFIGMKNMRQAKQEILDMFSNEPDSEYVWSKRDSYEQARKIIIKWKETKSYIE